jgi:hypothetical protein
VINSLQASLDPATLSLGEFQTDMQRDIDRQVRELRHEMRDAVEKLTADVAAVARFDASNEKLMRRALRGWMPGS